MSSNLSPNWLAEEFDRVEFEIMTNHSPGDYFVGKRIDPEQKPLTDQQKLRLLSRLETRFQAWAGESANAFRARMSAKSAAHPGGSNAEP